MSKQNYFVRQKKKNFKAILAVVFVLAVMLAITILGAVKPENKAVLKTAALENSNISEPILGDTSITDVVEGANFAVALDSSGNVWSWGQNNKGQLGNGTFTSSLNRTKVMLDQFTQLSNVKQIAAGDYHVAALTANGDVYMWGYNYFGQTGSENKRSETYPVKVNGLNTIKQIGCGADFTIMLTTDGKVLGIGDSSNGQLGYYNTLAYTSLREIAGLSGIKKIAAGNNFILVLNTNGKIYSLGGKTVAAANNFQTAEVQEVIGSEVNFTDIKAGNGFSIALDSEGKVYSWSTDTTIRTTDITATSVPLGSVGTVRTTNGIAVVNKTGYIINNNNEVYSFGNNTEGIAGVGSTDATISAPTKMIFGNGVKVEDRKIDKIASYSGRSANLSNALGTANYSGFAISAEGYVLGWGYAGKDISDVTYKEGDNNYKLLGDGTKSYIDYIGNLSLKKTANEDIILEIEGTKEIGEILGEDSVVGGKVNLYRDVKEENIIDSLTVTAVNPEIATYEDGVLTGVAQGRTVIEVKGVKNSIFINVIVLGEGVFPKISSNGTYSVALAADGTVWAWGYSKPLGIINEGVGIPRPVQINGLEDIVDIAAGEDFILALTKDGKILTYGKNDVGQLGDGTTESSTINSILNDTPEFKYVVDAETGEILTGITQIVAERDHAIALDEDNQLYGWGINDFGQLGVGNDESLTTGALKTDMTNIGDKKIKQIAVGEDYSLALTTDGLVYAYGWSGEKIPTQMTILDPIIKISSNSGKGGFIYAVTTTGQVTYFRGLSTARRVNLGNVKVVDIDSVNGAERAIALTVEGKLIEIEGTEIKATFKEVVNNVSTDFSNAMSIYAGQNFYSVIKTDGTVWTSGANTYGQLGNRSLVDSASRTGMTTITIPFVSLNFNEVTLRAGESSEQIVATYNSGFNIYKIETETDREIECTTLFEDIATVEDGVITAVAPGTGYIYVTDTVTETVLRIKVNVLASKETTLPAISQGYNFNMALRSDGTVWGWGTAEYGDLGQLGSTTEPTYLGIDGIIGLSSGKYHTIMITEEGTVVSLGRNSSGELGNGTNKHSNIPVQVMLNAQTELTNIVKVIAHDYRSMALDADGNVYIWGSGASSYATKLNTFGIKVIDIAEKLIVTEDGKIFEYNGGTGLNYQTNTNLSGIVSVASANGNYLAIQANSNKVYQWTSNNANVNTLTFEENIVEIEAGNGIISYAKGESGKIYTWGNNDYYQTFLGKNAGNKATPVEIEVFEEYDSPIDIIVASKESANRRSYAVTLKGSVYVVGSDSTKYYTPTLIGEEYAGIIDDEGNELVHTSMVKGSTKTVKATLLNSFNVRAISPETAEESIFDWSVFNGTYLTIEDSQESEEEKIITAGNTIGEAQVVAVDEITGRVAKAYIDIVEEGTLVAPKVESTEDHTVALKADGTVWVWGNNGSLLGINDRDGKVISTPTQVIIGAQIAVSEPRRETVTLEDGSRATKYYDSQGNEVFMYGSDSSTYYDADGRIVIRRDTKNGNGYYKWDANTGNYALKNLLKENEYIVDISTASNHTLLLTNTGEVYSFGYNRWSGLQLGRTTLNNYGYLPAKVAGLKDIVRIATGFNESADKSFSFALDKYGKLWAFGYNYFSYQELDDYQRPYTKYIYYVDSWRPKRITYVGDNYIDTTNAIDVTNQFILTAEGKVVSLQTAYNSFKAGEEVEGLPTNERIVKITKTSGNISSYGHTAFLTESGSIYMLGYGTQGQLGNDSKNNSLTRAIYVRNERNVRLTNIRDIYVGTYHTIAVDTSGNIYTWGSNSNDALRTSATLQGSGIITRAYKVKDDARITNAIAVSAGNSFCVAVNENGYVYSWGNGLAGQLGNSIRANSKDAVRVGTEGIILKNNNYITLQVGGSEREVVASSNLLNLLITPSASINSLKIEDVTIAELEQIDEKTFKVTPKTKAGKTYIEVTDFEDRLTIVPITVLPEEAELSSTVKLPAGKTIEPMTVSGESHTLILKSDGTVWAYGQNTYGQTTAKDTIGQLSAYSDKATQVDFGDTAIVQIAAGDMFSLALDSKGNVYSWGYNTSGQLGRGETQSTVNEKPQIISGLSNIVKITAGGNQAMAISDSGKVYTWGKNMNGSLGTGDSKDYNTPVEVPGISRAIDIAVGDEHSLVLTSQGKVYATGKNTVGQLGQTGVLSIYYYEEVEFNKPIVSIATGGSSNFAIDVDGKVWAWGLNEDGQLGIGSSDAIIYTPQLVSISEKVIRASAGKNHSHLITASGKIFITGLNNFGQLGLGEDIEGISTFTQIQSFGTNVMNSNAGSTYSTVIDKNGLIYGFGDYNHGDYDKLSLTDSFTPVLMTDNTSSLDKQEITLKIGESDNVPVLGRNRLNVLHKDTGMYEYSSVNTNIAQVDETGVITGKSVGTTLVKVIDSDGKVNVITVRVIPEEGLLAPTVDSGKNYAVMTDMAGKVYEVGYNLPVIATKDLPAIINDSVSFKSVKAGDDFVVAINNDGTVWGWGDNSVSQVGIEGLVTVDQTARLNRNYIKDAEQIDAGSRHVIALDNLGTVYVWGNNRDGQLGIDPTGDDLVIETPKAVRLIAGKIISVSAGGNYSAIVDNDGNAYIIYGGTAHKVSGISGAIKVATSDSKSLILTNDGSVYLVNNNNTLIASAVAGASDIVDIAADNETYMLLDKDGNIYTFGNNDKGQLGSGKNNTSVNTPEKVAENAFAIGVGNGNTYYIGIDGDICVAGTNVAGELGNGTREVLEGEEPIEEKIIIGSINTYARVGDRSIQVKPDIVKISTNWNLYVGSKSVIDAFDEDDRTVLSGVNKIKTFNVFNNELINTDEFEFEIEDTSIAEIDTTNTNKAYVKIIGGELGETRLTIRNKATGEENILDILVVRAELLKIKNIFLTDSTEAVFDSTVQGESDYVVNIEGAAADTNAKLNIILTLANEIKAYLVDEQTQEETELTIDGNRKNYAISGFDLSKESQTIKLIIGNGDPIYIYLYKEDMVRINQNIVSPVKQYNENTNTTEKSYLKHINPEATTATISIQTDDVRNQIILKDLSGNVIAEAEPGVMLNTTVDIPSSDITLRAYIVGSNGKSVREFNITVTKTSIAKFAVEEFIEGVYVTPMQITAEKLDIDSEGYVETYYVELDEATRRPLPLFINFTHSDIEAVRVDDTDVTSRLDGLSLEVKKKIQANTDPIEITVELDVVDGTETYTERYLLVVDLISSNNNISKIRLIDINGNAVLNNILKAQGYTVATTDEYGTYIGSRVRSDVEEKNIHELVLHNPDAELDSIEYIVDLETDKAEFSLNGRTWKNSGDSVQEIAKGSVLKLTANGNKYEGLKIIVRAENKAIKSHVLYIYKQSENAKIENIEAITNVGKSSLIKDGNKFRVGVLKGQTEYIVSIKLEDEYATLDTNAITIDGVEDVSSIITNVIGGNGQYTLTVTREALDKVINLKVDPEFERAPSENYQVTLKEMDDNHKVSTIEIDDRDVLAKNFTGILPDAVSGKVNAVDPGKLYIKAESETAEITITDIDGDVLKTARGEIKDFVISFEEGDITVLNIKVKSEDSTKEQSTVLTVKKASNNANVKSITAVEPDREDIRVAEFVEIGENDEIFYKLGISGDVTTPVIKVKTENTYATVTININGEDIAVGEDGVGVDIIGTNELTLKVTSEDETVEKEYIVKIVRLSSSLDFIKEIKDSDGKILKDNDSFEFNAVVDSGYTGYLGQYNAKINEYAGDVSLSLSSIDGSYPEAKMIKDGNVVIPEEERGEYVRDISFNSTIGATFEVQVTAADGKIGKFILKILPEKQIAKAITIKGYADDTEKDTKTIDPVAKEEYLVTVDPESTKAIITLQQNVQYNNNLIVSARVKTYDVQTETVGFENVEVTNAEPTTNNAYFAINLLDDAILEKVSENCTTVMLEVSAKNSDQLEIIRLNIRRGSTIPNLDKIVAYKNNKQVDEAVYEGIYKAGLALPSENNTYDFTIDCPDFGTYVVYEVSEEEYLNTALESIDLTNKESIAQNEGFGVTLGDTTKYFVIRVTSEYRNNSRNYGFEVRKKSSKADLVNLEVLVNNESTKKLVENMNVKPYFDEDAGLYIVDIPLPIGVTSVGIKNITVNGINTTIKWTDIMQKEDLQDSEIALYDETIKSYEFLGTESLGNIGMLIETTSEDGHTINKYLVTFRQAEDKFYLETAIYDRTLGAKQLITQDVRPKQQEILDLVQAIRLDVINRGQISTIITKLNDYELVTPIDLSLYKVINENSWELDLSSIEGTYVDDDSVENTISLSTAKTITFKTTIVPESVAIYPEYYMANTINVVHSIKRLSTNANIMFKFMDAKDFDDWEREVYTKDLDFTTTVEEDMIIKSATIKVSSDMLRLIIEEISSEDPATKIVYKGMEINGAIFYETDMSEDPESSIDEDFVVTSEDGKVTIYRITFKKKSQDLSIDGINVNDSETAYDKSKKTYMAGVLVPMGTFPEDITIDVLTTLPEQTVKSHITHINGNKITNKAEYEGISRNIYDELVALAQENNIELADIENVTVALTVFAEDTDYSKNYKVNITIEETKLDRVVGLDLDGNISEDSTITGTDFVINPDDEFEYTTDVIVVPNATEAFKVKLEASQNMTIVDESGYEIENNEITISDLTVEDVSTYKFKVVADEFEQRYSIRIRKASLEASLTALTVEEIQATKDNRATFSVRIPDTIEIPTVLANIGKGAKITDIQIGENDNIVKLSDNSFKFRLPMEEHNDESENRNVQVVISVQPEDWTVEPTTYTLKLTRMHSDNELSSVTLKYTQNDEVKTLTTDFATAETRFIRTTDEYGHFVEYYIYIASATLPSTAESFKISSVLPECKYATVYVNNEAVDVDKEYEIADGQTITFNVKVAPEYGTAKTYEFNVRRTSKNTNITGITIPYVNGTNTAISYNSQLDEYSANINVQFNPVITVNTQNEFANILDSAKVYITTPGDLDDRNVTIEKTGENSFTIAGLAELYVDDQTEDASEDADRIVTVNFTVEAEDDDYTKEYTIKLTRKHIDANLSKVEYTYMNNEDETPVEVQEELEITENTDINDLMIIVPVKTNKLNISNIVKECKYSTISCTLDGEAVDVSEDLEVLLDEVNEGDGAVRYLSITITADDTNITETYNIMLVRTATNAVLNQVKVKGVVLTMEESEDENIAGVYVANLLDTDSSVTISADTINVFATVTFADDERFTADTKAHNYLESGTFRFNAEDKEVEFLITVQPQDTNTEPNVYKLVLIRKSTNTKANISIVPRVDELEGSIEITNVNINSVIEIPVPWTEIGLVAEPQDELSTLTIEQVDKVKTTIAETDSFVMPESEKVAFKIKVVSESGLSSEYKVVMYKKATSIAEQKITVNGNAAVFDEEAGVYKAVMNSSNDSLSIVVTTDNLLGKTGTIGEIETVEGPLPLEIIKTVRNRINNNQLETTVGGLKQLDLAENKMLKAHLRIQTEDEVTEVKTIELEITRQTTNTSIDHININTGLTVQIGEEEVDISKQLLKADIDRGDKVLLSSQAEVAVIDEIELEDPNATYKVTINDVEYTTFPIEIPLPNEKDEVDVVVTVKPEFEFGQSARKVIKLRRTSSDVSFVNINVDAHPLNNYQNSTLAKAYTGSEEGIDYIKEIFDEIRSVNIAIAMDQTNNSNISMKVESAVNASGRQVSTNILSQVSQKNAVLSGTLNTKNSKFVKIKIEIEPEDTDMPKGEYILEIAKLDNNVEIKQISGNEMLAQIDEQPEHYKFVGLNEYNDEIYEIFIDEDVEDVNTIIETVSPNAKIDITEDVGGIGVAEYSKGITGDLEELQFRVTSQDGRKSKVYRIWYIKKTDDTSIAEVYVDDVEIPQDEDGNYRITIPDITKQIKVKMVPTYKFASAEINGQQFKWQETTEIIEINEYSFTDRDRIEIELAVLIPPYQNGKDVESYNDEQKLYVSRVSTENTIEHISTDSYNDTVSQIPQSAKDGIRDTGYPNTYEVLLDMNGKDRNTIALNIQPTSPTAKVVLRRVDGQNVTEDDLELTENGTLTVDNVIVNANDPTIFEVEVTPLQQNGPKLWYIYVTPPASQAELQYIWVDGEQIDIIPGQYKYDIFDLGLEGIGAVTAQPVYDGTDTEKGTSLVNIYTRENPTGTGEVEGTATLQGVDFSQTSYISITVISPNGRNTNTYILWLINLSADREIKGFKFNDDVLYPELAEGLPSGYAGQYTINISPEETKAKFEIEVDPLARIKFEENEPVREYALIDYAEGIKDMVGDKYINLVIIAENGEESVYRILIHRKTVGKINVITENKEDNYLDVAVEVINSNDEILVETNAIDIADIDFDPNETYSFVIKKPGYLKHTLTGFKPAYGRINNLGTFKLLAGDVTGDNDYIDLIDLVQLNKKARANIGTGTTSREETYDAIYDFNADGIIDETDLNILITNYDKGATASAFARYIDIKGYVYNNKENIIPNAYIAVSKDSNITFEGTTTEEGEYGLLNTVIDTGYTVQVKDESGNTLGTISNLSIEVGDEEKVEGHVITVTPNTVAIGVDIRINNGEIIISAGGEKPEADVNLPEIVNADFKITNEGIQVIVEGKDDKSLGKLTVYDEEGAYIGEAEGEGTEYTFNVRYNKIMDYGEETKVTVVLEDNAGNELEPYEMTIKNYTILSIEDFTSFVDSIATNTYEGEIVKLGADIDMSVIEEFAPIGKSKTQAFQGTFDGCGYVIKNINVNQVSNYAGFFGYAVDATIKNLGIESGTIKSTKSYIGGIVGYAVNTTVERCYVKANIEGSDYVGGIIGYSSNSIIKDSYTTGTITATGKKPQRIGGIVGYMTAESRIENCYSTGLTNNTALLAGYIGTTLNADTGVATGGNIVNCYVAKQAPEDTGYLTIQKDYVTVTIADITKATLAQDLGNAFIDDEDNINNGYAILKWQKELAQGGREVLRTRAEIRLASPIPDDAIALPLDKEYYVTSEFGERPDPINPEEIKVHYGIDLSTGSNDNVLATANGVVTYVGKDENSSYGYCIEIKHKINDEIIYSFYGHLKSVPELNVGDVVTKGQIIGVEGETGKATGIHLHFETRKISQDYSSAVDPRNYLEF